MLSHCHCLMTKERSDSSVVELFLPQIIFSVCTEEDEEVRCDILHCDIF